MKAPRISLKALYCRGNRGIALVYIALMLVVLLAFVGLAIDIGYMYVAKTQLQNAADSAALAGASRIDSTGLATQTAARTEAIKFASENQSTNTSIIIDPNTSNDPNGDIVVGYWNGTVFSPAAANQQINAVKVTARRTAETGTGIALTQRVALFFSKVIGWPSMAVKASSVAYAKGFWAAPLVLCVNACGQTGNFYLNKNLNNLPTLWQGTAWTLFSASSAVDMSSQTGVPAYINGTQFLTTDLCYCNPATCSQGINECGITTNNGVGAINDLESRFHDRDFYKGHKTFDNNGNVLTWDVMMPILDSQCSSGGNACPPYLQGSPNEPYRVWGWAMVTLTAVTGSGGGSNKGFSATVSAINCASCPNSIQKLNNLNLPNYPNISQVKPILVQ